MVFSELGTAHWLTLEGYCYCPLLQREGSGNGILPNCCLFFLSSHNMCKKTFLASEHQVYKYWEHTVKVNSAIVQCIRHYHGPPEKHIHILVWHYISSGSSPNTNTQWKKKIGCHTVLLFATQL